MQLWHVITIKTGIVIGWDSGTGNLKVKVITDDFFSVNDRIDDTNAGTSPVTARESVVFLRLMDSFC